MIVKLTGKLIETGKSSAVVNVQGIYYEILVPLPVLDRLEDHVDEASNVTLIIYHYIQISPSNGFPVLIGFLNEVERDFFMNFIKVSGIGPRAAVKALSEPISEISRAIDEGDFKYLKSLPGIGIQKAKEIVAKLQGKIGKYGLIRDSKPLLAEPPLRMKTTDWQDEALAVLLQLEYNKAEAMQMIHAALQRSAQIHSTEELLNEIYKQRINL